MEFSMVVTAKTFEQVALEDPDGRWELDHGCLRRKPQMTLDHDWLTESLTGALIRQVDTHGIVELHALPGVSIDFDALFD